MVLQTPLRYRRPAGGARVAEKDSCGRRFPLDPGPTAGYSPRMKPSDLLTVHVDRWLGAVKGRTLATLAGSAGVHTDTLRRWCSVRSPDPCSPEWRRICAALGLTPTQRRELALAVGLDPEVLAVGGGAP